MHWLHCKHAKKRGRENCGTSQLYIVVLHPGSFRVRDVPCSGVCNVKSNYFFVCDYGSFSFILWAHISRYFIWLNSFRSINFVCMYMSCVCAMSFYTQYLCDAGEIVNMFLGRFASHSHIYKLLKNLWSHRKRGKRNIIMLKRETSTTSWVPMVNEWNTHAQCGPLQIEWREWDRNKHRENERESERMRAKHRIRCEKSDENVYT